MALTTFRLYGSLGKRFGKVHRLECHTPGEGITGLCVKLPGFQHHMMAAHLDGIAFRISKGKHKMGDVSELGHTHGDREITIAPVVGGAKSGGLGQLLVGVAVIVASFYTGGLASAAFGASAATASAIGAATFSFGVSLTLGGAMQMLSPQAQGLQTREDVDNKASYAFGGPVSTTAQGSALGILYGEREIGGGVISAGIVAEDYNG